MRKEREGAAMLDLLTICIIAVFVIIGFKKGIARTAISLGSTLAVALLSGFLSGPIAEGIYESSVKPSLMDKINTPLKSAQEMGRAAPVEEIIDSLPGFIKNSMPNFNIAKSKLYEAIQGGAESAERLLRPLIVSFITTIVSVVLFAVLMIIAKIIIKIVCDKMDMVALGTVDSFFGALVGLGEGFIIVIAISFILRLAIPHINNIPDFLSDESISESVVFKGIYDSPILRDFVFENTESPNIDEI